MKLLVINVVCGVKSTGRIVTEIAKEYESKGYEVKIAYGRDNVPDEHRKYAVRIGSKVDVYYHVLSTRIFDNAGFCSKKATKRFLEWAEQYNPDELWLHNLHGYYINIPMLFDWIKSRPNMEVKWTLHDCWSFTGHCTHFMMTKCERWKDGCYSCPEKREYPCSFIVDNSKRNYLNKKEAFSNVKNLTLITPSVWLKELVKKSFLAEYPVEVRYNKIDTSVFKPCQGHFRERHNLLNKKILLGVASSWSDKKGLSDFIRLAKALNENIVIVLVGIDEKLLNRLEKKANSFSRVDSDNDGYGVRAVLDYQINKKNDEKSRVFTEYDSKIKRIGDNIAINPGVENIITAISVDFKSDGNDFEDIIGVGTKIYIIRRTDNAQQLAEIYSEADIFINPTYEDNYPTVNLEAQACGTKVITYNVGGCIETLGLG